MSCHCMQPLQGFASREAATCWLDGSSLHANHIAMRFTTNILQAGVQKSGLLHQVAMKAGQLHQRIATLSVPVVHSGVVGAVLGKLHKGMADAVEDFCLVRCATSASLLFQLSLPCLHLLQLVCLHVQLLPCCHSRSFSCCHVWYHCYWQHKHAHRLT